MQTLTYFHIVLKILRLSYVKNMEKIEADEAAKRRSEVISNARKTNKNLIANFVTIEEEEAQMSETASQAENQYQTDAKAGRINEGSELNSEDANEADALDMLDEMLGVDEEERKIVNTYSSPGINPLAISKSKEEYLSQKPDPNFHASTGRLDASQRHRGTSTEESSKLLDSTSNMTADLTQGERNDTVAELGYGERDFKEKIRSNRRQEAMKSIQLDRDCLNIKKAMRDSMRATDHRMSNRFSYMLERKSVTITNGVLSEEEIMINVGSSVLQIFNGCHQDSLKITMSLRSILFTNF